jgi:tRNA dimethylallyltransferase
MAGGAASIQCVCLAGPTASGKSALALSIAERIGGMVINTDSMQVYADLKVITARPTAEETGDIPHLLYGHVDAAVRYSAGRFLDDAAAAIASVRQQGRIPIFAGGTGLYFKGLLEGFSPIPPVPESILSSWNTRLTEEGAGPLHALLQDRDPILAGRISAGDSQRIIRALSVHEATGRPLSHWQAQPGMPLVERDMTLRLFLDPGRDWLTARINRRFERMMEQGAVEEVERLHARKLDPTLPAMRAHGVPHLIAMLEGNLSRDR